MVRPGRLHQGLAANGSGITMPIRVKTILVFLILSLVPLAALGWLAYKNGEETIQQSLGASFEQIASEAIDKVDRSLYEVYQNVQTWAGLEFMQEVITGDVDAKVSSFLVGVSNEYHYFIRLSVLNHQREAVASSDFGMIGKDMSREDCVRAMSGKPYVGDVHFSQMSQSWVITFAFPIKAKFEEGKVIGVLCANWKADELFTMTQTPTSTNERSHGHLTLLRNDGLVISASEQEREDVFNRNLLSAQLQSARLATQGKRGRLIERDERGHRSLIGYGYSKGYRDFPGLGWAALVAQDVRVVFEPIERLKFIILGLGVAVACGVILISLILAQRMTTPILKIAQVAHRVSRGDFEASVQYASSDEIGSLTRTFNQMIQDLRRQRAQLVDKAYVDNIIKSMIDTLIVIEPSGTIKTVNRAACQLLGYTEEELIGQPITVIFAKKEGVSGSADMNAWIEERLLKNIEDVYVAKDGRHIPMRCSSAILRDDEGRVQGIVCVAQDITERKQAEEAMRRHAAELARSNAELEQFAYIASHDLQEPLRTIGSYTQLLARRYKNKLDTDADEFIAFVVSGTIRMQTLINDLLTYSRVGTRAKPFESTDCTAVADEAIKSLQVAIQESGAVITHDALPVVTADASQMGQLFQNLIGNAIKFRGKESPRVHLSAERQGADWLFAVSDNGIGIDPRYVDRIFIVFQRLHTQAEYPGTGIGLAVCKKIIERHGGNIWVESQPGAGAKFLFTIPADHLPHTGGAS